MLRSRSGTFLKPAHRSAPAPAIFDSLCSAFRSRSAHMLWCQMSVRLPARASVIYNNLNHSFDNESSKAYSAS